jgi:hypothetical protein
MKDAQPCKQASIVATYDDDTKRMHRFIISEGQGFSGSIYIPKGAEIPDSITVKLQTKAEADKAMDEAEKEKQGED